MHIRLSDKTLVPFSTRGLRNYYVVIPSHMLESSHELRVSLAHEFQHIRQGDLEWEVVMEALKPLFFLNPAYHAWKRQVEQLRELNCDREVLSSGRIDVSDYCETLLSVCQKTLRRDRAFVIAVPKVTLVTADRSSATDGKLSLLENRIRSVLNARRLGHQRLVLLVTAVPLVAAVAVASIAIQRPGDWSQDRLMLSTVVNLDRLDEINRLSTFGRIRN
jgi:beta-lactamase regulating signal transducer with metallopeptidase domain